MSKVKYKKANPVHSKNEEIWDEERRRAAKLRDQILKQKREGRNKLHTSIQTTL